MKLPRSIWPFASRPNPSDASKAVAASVGSSRTPEPVAPVARPPAPCWVTSRYSPETHAAQLLALLQSHGVKGEMTFPQLQDRYRKMCLSIGWAVRPWNPVACAFTKLTTGRKVYRWFLLADGRRHRLRVYPIIPRGTANGSTAVPPSGHVAQTKLRGWNAA